MGSSAAEHWLTWAFGPAASAILVTLLIAILSPIALHFYFYRQRARSTLSRFLLVGPSGAGKTTLAIFLQNGRSTRTHTSQDAQTIECLLPSDLEAASQGFRSNEDPTVKAERKFVVVDTPGHGKLRHHATEQLSAPRDLRGVIFVVDSAAISNPLGLTETATYLHDVLLLLQKQHTDAKSSRGPALPPVLIAANKLDLFTAMPATLVEKQLEDEITNIRATRAKGLLDSATGTDDAGEDRDWLGEGGEGPFKFSHLAESEIEVSVVGGNLVGEGDDAGQIKGWWTWVGDNM